MARHVYTYINPTSERDLDAACKVLEDNGVIAYPTDVNWAFACDAANVKALDRIRLLKPMHPKERPFSLVCWSISMASEVVNIDNAAYRYLKRALPGPYTVILERFRSLPRQIKDKRRTVGLRIPDSPLILELVKKYGKPLATTSVPPVRGIEGEEAPKFGYQVFEVFGHGIDLVLDLGDEVPGGESTIVDMTAGEPVLVRLGLGDPKIFDLAP
jgi:tRNA threonylcarbamoyl adenosine modification protein (Sua5/YciO/YrdC/YwlC family)